MSTAPALRVLLIRIALAAVVAPLLLPMVAGADLPHPQADPSPTGSPASSPASSPACIRIDAETATRLAIARSPLEREAAAKIEAARAAVKHADAARLPVIELTSTLQHRSSVPELSAPILGPSQPPITIFPDIRTAAAAGISARQALLTFGATSGNRHAARLALESSTYGRTATLDEVKLAARLAYWEAVAARAACAAARADLERADRLLDDVRAFATAGMAVHADVLAAEARLAASRVALLRAETDRDIAFARLRSLLAVEPSTRLELADVPPIEPPTAPQPLAPLLEQARDRRPELAMLGIELARLQARARAIAAGTRPALDLVADWTTARPNQRYLPLEDVWNSSWSVGLLASWRLYDGQRTDTQVAELNHERDALAARRDELARGIELEVEQAHLELTSALATVASTDVAAKAARAREQAEHERYRAGMISIADVLDAQAEVARTELDQTVSRAAAWLARARLDRALGQ